MVQKVLDSSGHMVCLIKPQFEAGREQVGKNGIVRDPAVHRQVIENVLRYASENGLEPLGLAFSPVKGTKGNIEYLLFAGKAEGELPDNGEESVLEEWASRISGVVQEAHADLD